MSKLEVVRYRDSGLVRTINQFAKSHRCVATVSAVDNEGNTALMYAVRSRASSVADGLMQDRAIDKRQAEG